MPDLDQHWSLSQEALESTHLVNSFRQQQRTTQPAPQMTHPKGRLSRHQNPVKKNFTPWGQLLQTSLSTPVTASPHSSQPEAQPHPLMCQKQSKLNYNRRAHTTQTKDTQEAPNQVTRKTAPLGLTGHPLYEAAWPELGYVADLLNT